MIVQHTDKECKTKFSMGVEFSFLFNVYYRSIKNLLEKSTIICYNVHD